MQNAILFSFHSYEYIASKLLESPNVEKGAFTLDRFSNQELHLSLQTHVSKHDCVVLGSISPPDINLLSFQLLCHTLKKEHAAKTIALLPYLAYTRHDKNESQKSFTTAFIAELLYRSGIDELITLDIHSQKARELFPMPVISLSTAALFAQEIQSQSLQDAVIVAPDDGAIKRGEEVAKKANITRPVCYLEKKRTEEGIIHSKLHGEVGEHVIIIDDILDTGGTLISCCKHLARAGVKRIEIMVTHGIFTGTKWTELWQLNVNRIYCTNTIPLPPHFKQQPITELSIVPLLQAYFATYSKDAWAKQVE